MIDIQRNDEENRFEAIVNGKVAFVSYEISDGSINLFHTEVPPEFEGEGIGGELVKTALEYARAQGLSVIPTCPFAAAYIRRHREYQDLVGG
jgi:predicted GNAT family acetyltransferase